MTHRTVLSYLIAGALCAPIVTSTASAAARTSRHEVRIYDREHHDYHKWNTDEQKAYRHYLEERHDAYRAYSKARAKERLEYWKWRHQHMDERF